MTGRWAAALAISVCAAVALTHRQARPPESFGGKFETLRPEQQRLVAELTPAQRAAVTMFYYEGRSVEQVAAILGMPENTVKTHLLRARAALRTAWTHEMGDEA